MMNKELMTAKILEAKATQGVSWEKLASAIGLSPVFTTSACLGMNSLTEDKAFALCETLGLDKGSRRDPAGVPQNPGTTPFPRTLLSTGCTKLSVCMVTP